MRSPLFFPLLFSCQFCRVSFLRGQAHLKMVKLSRILMTVNRKIYWPHFEAFHWAKVCTIIAGTEIFSAEASSLLYEVLWSAAGKVPSPKEHFKTIYDEWLDATTGNYRGRSRPKISNLGSGSDYAPFLQLQGISSADIRYVRAYVYEQNCNNTFKGKISPKGFCCPRFQRLPQFNILT